MSEQVRHLTITLLADSNLSINRYYVAEGVRLYSQETWRQITQGQGVKLVERYIENVVNRTSSK